MIILNGKGVSKGIAFGKLYLYERSVNRVEAYGIEDAEAEVQRFEAAKVSAAEALMTLHEKALAEVGEEDAAIFEIHQMMLEDADYCEGITGIIRSRRVNAETAVSEIELQFAGMFEAMEDDYMKGRAADIRDISARLLQILGGTGEKQIEFHEPVIIVADDLVPSETVQFDKSMVLGFITAQGSSNAHTAILARTMGIPAIIRAEGILEAENDGCSAIADGTTGEIYISPNVDTVRRLKEKKEAEDAEAELLMQLKGRENITLDGQKVELYANIGSDGDLNSVIANDAGGIGLFRSEFLYLEREDYPSEEDQFQVYKRVLERMEGKKVIVRTLDIGADKQVDYFKMDQEENPAMGYRAIRICLDRKEIFFTQLRALYRASAYGNLGIMIPMIINADEVREVKAMAHKVQEELAAEDVPFSSQVEIGIMIETPAAAIISDVLAAEVDFFSVGTNDLTQYTLAIDRRNDKLAHLYDDHHKAVLRLIKMTADSAHRAGIWVGICGELAADSSLTETFLAMGIDELSVTAGAVLGIRKKILELDVSQSKARILEGL